MDFTTVLGGAVLAFLFGGLAGISYARYYFKKEAERIFNEMYDDLLEEAGSRHLEHLENAKTRMQ